MTQNNVIAVTGGIGSGKSVVCGIIADMAYPVLSCDEIYKDLLRRGELLTEIKKEFGSVVIENGELNRAKLSSIVFNDKSALKRLNKITHPAIFKEAFRRAEGKNLLFLEVPLLFEEGYEKNFRSVIVVLREFEKRVQSVAKRDKISEEEVKKRINSQLNYENYDFAKYYVIHNSGNLEDLSIQTVAVVKEIVKKF